MSSQEYLRQMLPATDLTISQQRHTLQTYSTESETFAETEWDRQSIEALLNGVFTPLNETINKFIKENRTGKKTKHKVAFLGCGNAAEVAMMAMFSKSVYVNALDISLGMLNSALNRLQYQYLEELAGVLLQSQFVSDAWIQHVVTLVAYISSLNDRVISEEAAVLLKQSALHTLLDRIELIQADMTDLHHGVNLKDQKEIDLTAERYDLVGAVASTQHITKPELLVLTRETLEILNPGGVFFFNVRLDPDTTLPQGRVYSDNTLNGRWRYYNTFVLSELAALIYQLTGHPTDTQTLAIITPSVEGFGRFHLTTIQGLKILVEFTGISDHPDPLKPKFLGVKITRELDRDDQVLIA